MNKLDFYIRKYKSSDDEKQREYIHQLFKKEVIRQYDKKHKYDELKKKLKITQNFGL